MEVYCLRVQQTVAGNKFPFDRVYLVPYELRDNIEKLFRYALVLSVEGLLKDMLTEVPVNQYINRTQHRNDDESEPVKFPLAAWNELLGDDTWLMVVPVLPKWMHQNTPRYLVAEAWYRKRYKRVGRSGKEELPERESPFTVRSYLQTPHKKIRPICVACPRMILHQNGECQIGGEHCFTNLPLGLVDHFAEAEAVPDATPNIQEPEEHEILEGEQLDPEAVPAPNTTTRNLLRVLHE